MGITQFFLRKAIWKGIRRALQVAVAAVASSQLASMGVTIDQTMLTAALTGLIETGLNTAKQKYPNILGWL